MSACIFCEILAGRASASMVYQDDLCSAFMDIHQPESTGHVLVVPNAHASNLSELPEETGAHLFKVAQRITAAMYRSEIPSAGVNLLLADGTAAGQEVFHVHLHVLARNPGDRAVFRFDHSQTGFPARAVLDKAAEKIRSVL